MGGSFFMRVLVTGGAGYIGSVCVQQLLDGGHDVAVFDSLVEGHRRAVDARVTLIVNCLKDEAAISTAVKSFSPEVVIHFAGLALGGQSFEKPGEYFRVNFSGGLNLLHACVEAGVRKVIFSSTCATYGVPDELPITESTLQRPINPYGESKLMFEQALRWFHEIHGLEYVAFRYFNAAGATELLGEHHRIETHLIPNVLFAAQGKREQFKIFGNDYPTPDGTCIRDYIHISDLCRAHVAALDKVPVGRFNLGTGRGYSVREVVDSCERVTGRKIPLLETPRRSGDPPQLVARADQAREAFGWEPEFTTIDSIIESAWRWHERNPDGYPD
ncbi:MAG: UDP-glucose 4-epimerase [Limisphaerales bacterium]|jgi:UDP-glucose 4-epimerase